MARTGRCMKCKQTRDMVDEQIVTMKNGRKAASGKCAVCGTKMFKILGKDDPAAAAA
jgi:hypothetical protein